MNNKHNFHIPIMGIGYTIDTPAKVAHLGIDSSISLVDDKLIEKMRKMYSEKLEIPFREISEKVEDFRAKRITSYLNLMADIAEEKFNDLKTLAKGKSKEFELYFDLLPQDNVIKKEFLKLREKGLSLKKIANDIRNKMSMGSIDVNIMTKVDKTNYKNGVKLSSIFNDAHAALRGFAQSKLNSSIILSAGLNPRLYSYMANFDDFFPDSFGNFKKKITLKVSDFKSALIQGKFLAKKGLWVSEYRIESGLNCGGHAFAKEGHLLGPILQQFKDNRGSLRQSTYELFKDSYEKLKNKTAPENISFKVSAQGGVGNSKEHNFLIKNYNIDSVGWGSPFLLVPEVVNVDPDTLEKVRNAGENDIYLSNISPLGVPFSSIRGNTKDVEKQNLIDIGKPGSACPKKYVALNTEFNDKGLCTASRRFQFDKIKELKKMKLSVKDFKKEFNKIVEKSCICVGLGTSALLNNDISTKAEGIGVSVCPGPNAAYFDKIMSLKDMVSQIYGKVKSSAKKNRPNMFIKELNIYTQFLKTKFNDAKSNFDNKNLKQADKFADDLMEGIEYYNNLFKEKGNQMIDNSNKLFNDLKENKIIIQSIKSKINAIKSSM